MEVKFDKGELNNLLVDYYKNYENTDSTVITKIDKDYDRYDSYTCELSFIVSRKMMICGKDRAATETLTEDEVKDIIKRVLTDEGYDVKRIEFNRGLESKCTGYGLGETIEMVPYYTGVSAYISNVKRKVKC